jgi:anti-sigma B factor antagonist
MNIAEDSRQGVVVLRVGSNRIDASSAADFRDSMAAIVARGVRRFVIDLAGVDFIDSTGLGALVATLKAAGPSGAVAVCGAKESVGILFKLTRMDKVFRMFPSDGEAAAALSRDAA